MQLSQHDLDEVERDYCSRGLINFTRRAWRTTEAGQAYVHGWHADAVAEHLQAAIPAKGANGVLSIPDINRLIINIPPGMAKSTLCGVMFPSWVWTFRPEARFLSASHGLDLAMRDNRKSRLLITSPWYQNLWNVRLRKDQSEKVNFENLSGGFRKAKAFASLTGDRGDFVVVDDPQNPEMAYSTAHREATLRIVDETLHSRLNDPERSAIIIIMQRLHEKDVSGHILERELGYEHLCLPMEFEPERKCFTSIGWEDPRTKDGELLFPERFPAHVVERDKKTFGSFAAAGQLQQRPTAREGGMFKRDWFNTIPEEPAGTRWVRGWDLAATSETESKTAAYTAAVKLGVTPDGRFIIGHVLRERASPAGVEALLKTTAQMDGASVRGSIPQDPGQAGKAQSQGFTKMLAGYPYTASPESGDKETRAQALAAQMEAKNVFLMPGDWNQDFIDELCAFPGGQFADQMDAASRAFMELTIKPQILGILPKKRHL